VLALLVALAVVSPPAARAATFVVINNDGPGEGFNDPTPVNPVGGNTGTTLGAQRLIAFQRATAIWGALLSSAVTIRVTASFDPLACNSTSAILGSAGPVSFFRDFGGVPLGSTWYPSALANALHGSDLDGSNDIVAQFNSSFGTTCAFPRGWYYGLDGNAGTGIDFVTVLLHELGHGLGFLTLVDLTTGAKALGLNDTFMLNLENHGATPSDYPSMSDAQRLAASISTGNLHWVGPHVRASSGILSAGKVGDHVQMYAPGVQMLGSSVSHWDTALSPNQLLEPIYTIPMDPVLELPLMQDIGWTLQSTSSSSTLQVTPPTDVVASGLQGGPFSPSAFQYQLTSTGSPVSFSISGVPSWLTPSATSGTTPATVTFTVNASANNLGAATYGPTTITVANTTNGQGTTTRAATLAVSAPVSALQVTGGNVAASGPRGGPFTPSTFQYRLSTSTGTASFSISGVPSWLTASATSGTATPTGATVTFTVNANANALAPGAYGPATITFTNTTNGQGTTTRVATLGIGRASDDFDGDGRTDFAVYRPSTGEWLIDSPSTGTQTRVFGAPSSTGLGDIPVPADYDGDGKTDMAIYRQATGEWFIFGTMIGFQTRVFGAPAASGLGDTPVPADFDGDGKADLAIYRKATGEWFIFGTTSGFQTRVFGAPASSGLGDTPVPVDFDGDGKADLAVYRKATGEWFIFGSGTGFRTLVFGAPASSGLGDTPVPMDYDGDRKADLAVYRKATGEWFIFGSGTGFRTLVFGAPASSGLGDVPVPGDYDGDGRADIAVRRSATAQWLILQSSDGATQTVTWGATSDVPLPLLTP
jgi:hypothetical protein